MIQAESKTSPVFVQGARRLWNGVGMLRTGLLAALLLLPLPANAQQQTAQYHLPRPTVPEQSTWDGSYIDVLDSRIHYVESGEGDPILFIHGNPTSSYLWRNVVPHLSDQGRAIAVDLIGMGRSGKPKIAYRYQDHYAYLSAFIEALNLRDITLVTHDWGAALGFDFAARNPDRVKRIAFMEGVLPPIFPQPSFEAMGEEMGGMFRAFKDPAKGRELIIENHMFVEQVLPGFVNRPLGEAAMTEYRQPYLSAADREPLLAWPREVPIAGEPQDVVERMAVIEAFMTTTDKPVLLLHADPGVVVPLQVVPWYVANIKNIETAFIGQGLHFLQEDQPDAIGRAISDWLRRTSATN